MVGVRTIIATRLPEGRPFIELEELSAAVGEIKMEAALALLRLEPHVRGDERLAPAMRRVLLALMELDALAPE